MGILSWFSGSKKAMDIAEKGVDGIISGLDHLNFSEEEKHKGAIGVTKLMIERVKLAISESSVRSMTRRIIAIMFCGTFLLLLLMAAFVYPWSAEFKLWSKHLFECSKVLVNPIIAIILFYFGSYGIGYLLDKRKEK